MELLWAGEAGYLYRKKQLGMALGRPELPLWIRGRKHTAKILFQPSPETADLTRRGNSNVLA